MLKKMFALTSAAIVMSGIAMADEGKQAELTEVKICPLMMVPVTNKNAKTDIIGNYKVYLCCGGCTKAWAKLSTEEKTKKIQGVLAKQESGAPKKEEPKKEEAKPEEPKKEETAELTEVKVCPVSLHAAGKDAPTEVIGKYKVSFCCAGCPATFAKLSAEEKETKIAAALKKQNEGEKKEG